MKGPNCVAHSYNFLIIYIRQSSIRSNIEHASYISWTIKSFKKNNNKITNCIIDQETFYISSPF